MLRARVLAAMLFAPLLFVVVAVGGAPLLLSCAVLAALMHKEALRLLAANAPRPVAAMSWCTAAAAFVLSVDAVPIGYSMLLVGGCSVAMLAATLVSQGSWDERAKAAGQSWFAAWYGAGLIGLLCPLRARPTDGLPLALLALFVPWAADTGAYFAGRALGRHKLAPTISPAKTIEGLIGGLACALALAGAAAWLWPHLPLPRLLVTSGAAALMGTVGDLSESLLKRSAGAKDSGRLIPGHGGVLDRFDSVLFAAWASYAISMLWAPVVAP